MAEHLRAVGASPRERRIPTTISGVNGRVDALETQIEDTINDAEARHQAVMAALGDLKTVIGKPSNGAGDPAIGIFHILESLDRRVKPFEAGWLQMKGALKVGIPLMTGSAFVLWFLAGDRIRALLIG